MIWRRRDALLRGLTRACATVLLLIVSTSHPQAAETEFGYTAKVDESYSGDVFRTGINRDPQGDFITVLGVDASLAWRTPRSDSVVNLAPEYIKYATFDFLDSPNYRLNGTWNWMTGRRSAIGLRSGYSQTNQQGGFQSFAGVGGNDVDAIVPLTRRINWDIEPYHRINVGRTWTLQTRAIYRSQHFSNPTLTDVATTALIFSADARVKGIRTVGGVVRYGVNIYDRNTSTTTAGQPQDEVLNIEATWAQQEGAVFRWRTAAGFFQVQGDNRPTSSQPTLRASASWSLERTTIQTGYNLGFSTVTGSVGTARSENLSVMLSRRWGLGFTASAGANYIRFESLVNDPVERFLDGYSLDLQARYNWPSRWGISFRVRHLTQEQTSGRSLDYFQASVGLRFTPDGPRTRRRGP